MYKPEDFDTFATERNLFPMRWDIWELSHYFLDILIFKQFTQLQVNEITV